MMSDYIIRPATRADFPALTALWRRVFGDSEDFIAEFFRTMWSPGCCAAAENGALASMGFCLTGPAASGRSCGYIYAMATDERHRGRGLAAAVGRALMDGAFANGVDIISTLPAEDSLNAWYESRLGMVPCFKKGGAGVVFPGNWLEFAKYCGPHDSETPDTLLAAARPGVSLDEVRGLGWECTFD